MRRVREGCDFRILTRNRHADAIVACPLLRDHRTWLGSCPTSEIDPQETCGKS